MSRILLTSALPYANGSIHLGHLVEYIQTDIFARYHRSIGSDIRYMCADDTHGTAIELRAEREGMTPEELIAGIWEEHTRDFAAFGVEFDHYYSTHSSENRELSAFFYEKLVEGGHVVRKTTTQMYSESLGRYLNDRMIKGTCPNPKCGATDQYGDVCERCNTTYDPTDLIDPYDVVSGQPPVLRETENLYVRLSDFHDFLVGWVADGVPQSAVRKFVDGWLAGDDESKSGLRDWCISRDAPYFGFEIPGEPGKYFYVWLDAPIGYIASTKNWADQNGHDWLDWWGADGDARVIHVIGKDIIYFHTLFWPAMLQAAGLKTPELVHVHGMLTVNREKMSKSRGTFINAATYLDHLDPEYLRFYYAAKLSAGVDDLDLSLEDFVARVNADLVNNVVNLCSRVTKFIAKRFDGEAGGFDAAAWPVVATLAEKVEAAKTAYEAWEFRSAIRSVAEAGDAVNLFFQEAEPWAVIKDDPDRAREICAVALHGACALIASLVPVTPRLAERFAACVGLESIGWEHASADFRPARVDDPGTLLGRLDANAVQAVVEASKVSQVPEGCITVDSFGDEITFDEFAKVDLRVGLVLEAEKVEKADKLLRLTVHCGQQKNIFAGVAQAYPDPSVLVGKRVIVVANLKPRKMRFGVSEGMLLATSADDDTGLQLVLVDDSAQGGWTVR